MPIIVPASFLGFPCEGGVDAAFKDVLDSVEQDLTAQFNALPLAQQVDFTSGLPTSSVAAWCGVRQSHKCFHAGGAHGEGIAIDVNYDSNPYIATRTGSTFGGEAGGPLAIRKPAVEACDRAAQFVYDENAGANLANRGPGEDTGQVYDRFIAASAALAVYLSLVFDPIPVWDNHPPDLLIDSRPESSLDTTFASRTKPKMQAVSDLAAWMSDTSFAGGHPSWSGDLLDAEYQYYRIIRDYELVRPPMLKGKASDPITLTRNPAHGNGFLNFSRQLAVALADNGIAILRWGACDFGPAASGDMMHFDMRPRS